MRTEWGVWGALAHGCSSSIRVIVLSRPQCLNSHYGKLLTVSAASPPLEHEAIWHSAVSTQRRQLPVSNDDRRDASGEDQQVVAQVEGGGAAFQFGTWLDIDTEPVDWSRERHKRGERKFGFLVLSVRMALLKSRCSHNASIPRQMWRNMKTNSASLTHARAHEHTCTV